MGCDIHAFAEVRRGGEWQAVLDEVFPLDEFGRQYYKRTHGAAPFDLRSYGLFGFLAGVRNYSDVPPVSEPKGLPDDASAATFANYEAMRYDAHSASWLTLTELLGVDYDGSIEDRRITVETRPNCFDGGCTAKPGGGKTTTWRDFLPDVFFRDLEVLKTLGSPDDVRVVFWFDN